MALVRETKLSGIRLDRDGLKFESDDVSLASLTPVAELRSGGDDWKPGRRVSGCQVSLEPGENGLEGAILWSRHGARLSVPLSVKIKDGDLEAHVGPAQGILPGERIELEFPRGLGWAPAGATGYLILPIGMGAMCDFSPARRARVIEKHLYSGGQAGLTMPLFGIVSGDRSLGCIVDTPFDCKLRTYVNRDRPAVYAQSPVWVIDERTNQRRTAHYFAQKAGSYVSIAKRYRRELLESGRFVHLDEKARGCPELEQTLGSLLGHRHLEFVEPPGADPLDSGNAYGYFRSALREGFDRVVAHDVLRGEPPEMSRAARFARSLSPGFRLCVYENYLDIFRPGEQPDRPKSKVYPAFDESLVARAADGTMRPNWRVRRKGQPDIWTYTVCPACRLSVALPQMKELRRIFGRGSIYIDVEGAVPLFDCHDPRHPVTKEQDARCRIRILREVKKRFGVVTTEALPQDFLAGVADVGSYFSVFPYSGYGNSEFRIMPPLVPIPLHPLVWHGSILNQTGTGTNYYQSDPPHAALFAWLADTMDGKGRRIAYKLRGTSRAELLSHGFLTGPRVIVGPDDAFHCDDVQITRFSDGTTVVGNFASIAYRWRGRTIPSMDFLITNQRLALELAGPSAVGPGENVAMTIMARNTWDQDIPAGRIVVLSRGLAHSNEPLLESEFPPLGRGVRRRLEFGLTAPEDEGRMWIVANLAVTGEEPWQVSEIMEIRVAKC